MSSDLEQRVSDLDREHVVAALRGHSVAGRLTLEELSDRIESAYAVRGPASRWIVALVGDVKRTGRWRLAEIAGPESTITVVALIGDMRVRVGH